MNGNNKVIELICSLGYNCKLGDSILIEDDKKINKVLKNLIINNDIGMDMVCGDCSGEVINFKDYGNGEISFYTTDNHTTYKFKLSALFIITNKEEIFSPFIYLISDKTILPYEATIRNYNRLDNFEYAEGVVLEDGTISFDSNVVNKCHSSFGNPNEKAIDFDMIHHYSYEGVLAYMNIQCMEFSTNPLGEMKKFKLEQFRTMHDVVK